MAETRETVQPEPLAQGGRASRGGHARAAAQASGQELPDQFRTGIAELSAQMQAARGELQAARDELAQFREETAGRLEHADMFAHTFAQHVTERLSVIMEWRQELQPLIDRGLKLASIGKVLGGGAVRRPGKAGRT